MKNYVNFFILLDSIDATGITPLIEILNSYGQWPMTVSNWTEDRFDWRKATASIRNTFGKSFLFDVSNFIDVKNTDISTLYVIKYLFSNCNTEIISF